MGGSNILRAIWNLQVDSNNQYNTECIVHDDPEAYYIVVNPAILKNLLEEFKSGNCLNMETTLPGQPVRQQIDLTGFKEAYERAMSLQLKDAD